MQRRYCEQKRAGVRVETRDDSEAPMIVGHAAVFFNEDEPGTEFRLGRNLRERIAPEAFEGALERGDDVRALRDHEPSLLLGRTTNGTLRLSVDERGLAFEIDPDETSVGRDTRMMIQRGDLTGASFGFIVSKEEFADDGDDVIRTIRSVDPLLDVSPVTYPAFPATDTAVRDFSQGLACYIAEHRDDDATRRLETRAAKLGIVVPKRYNPGALARHRARQLELMERELRR